ncbi:hypothetical protein AVEN_5884-1 [Araneus ventricosus]|uniref:Uncharacterized protein n=1 Tax=Araneus ventricosus TaxID=182803 RepID=A0A4Y2JS30_ARAVE|nr:hypothetical protein AVEN_5884-1 [Araneus ventricosus]
MAFCLLFSYFTVTFVDKCQFSEYQKIYRQVIQASLTSLLKFQYDLSVEALAFSALGQAYRERSGLDIRDVANSDLAKQPNTEYSAKFETEY